MIGEGLPPVLLVRARSTTANGECGVEQQHALACPWFEIAVVGDRVAEVRVQLGVDVHQRRWHTHPVPYRETQAVRLVGAVVRVLAEEQHLHVGERRQVQRGEHLVRWWVDGMRFVAPRRRTTGVRSSTASRTDRAARGSSPSSSGTLPTMGVVFDHLERAPLATLPTPLEAGPDPRRRQSTLGEARRPHWPRRRRQQGAQARVPLRRGRRDRCRFAGHRRRCAVEPLPDDRSGWRSPRARDPSRALRRSSRRRHRQPVAVDALRSAVALHRRRREPLG